MNDDKALNRHIIEEFRAHEGKVGGRYAGVPLLLLTTTGAKSGKPRLNPLAYHTDGERLVVIASKAGAPTHPDWYHNIVAYPDAPLIEVEVGSSPEAVAISVRDHGIGIPREAREKIFERFYRAFDLSQRAIPGLGMGFYSVAEIVKRHGGSITVESEVGNGSTFHLTLPLEGAAQ